jgi:nucleotide-binding universal stress UspA family protein
MGAVRKMLVPLDGSPPSLAALDHAVALAEDSGAAVDVLHVESPDEFEVGSSVSLSEAARLEAERAIEAALVRAEARLGERIARRTALGTPLRRIVELANAGRYDLIVMGTHGHVGRLHAILGSVAEGVVRNAPCPVLTVREPGGAYESFAEGRHGRPSVDEQARHRRPHT